MKDSCCKKLSLVSISILVPCPGVHNNELIKECSYIFNNDWSKFVMFARAPKWWTIHFTPEDLLRNKAPQLGVLSEPCVYA